MQIPRDIIQGCKARDRRSQHRLYELCFSLLMGVCRRYYYNDDEVRGVLNLGFLKIVTQLDKWSDHIPFEAWARRVMINTIIDEFRKNKKEKTLMSYQDHTDEQNINSGGVDYNQADLVFDAGDLEAMISRLPAMGQKVFNLFAIDGFSHKEIAAMLNISEGTSKFHLSSARSKLKQMLTMGMAEVKLKKA